MEIFYCPLYRRDKELKKHSGVYSYHFKDGKKSNGPEIFERNKDKLFFKQRGSPRKKIEKMPKEKTVAEIVEDAQRSEPVSVQEGKVDKGKQHRRLSWRQDWTWPRQMYRISRNRSSTRASVTLYQNCLTMLLE